MSKEFHAPLPIDIVRWTLALLPLVILFVLLVLRRWTAPQAGPIGMFTAGTVALLVFRTPWDTLAVASAKGVMDHSGQNAVLAFGIAAVAPAYAFAFLSNGIGAIGAFMTSSSTSSNVLFSDVQQVVAKLKGLPESTIIAAQNAGGAIGNAVAPAHVMLGASTAGISGQEGAILRKTIRWTIAAVVLTGIATVLLVMLTQP